MQRLWGYGLATVIVVVAFNVFLPQAITASTGGDAILGVLVLSLLGTGVLAGVADVSEWRDKGFILGTIWGLAGGLISTLLFGPGVWRGAQTPNDILNFRFYCLLKVGNAYQPGCLPRPAHFTATSFGSMAWVVVADLAILAVGMAICGVPVYLVARLMRGGRAKSPPSNAGST